MMVVMAVAGWKPVGTLTKATQSCGRWRWRLAVASRVGRRHDPFFTALRLSPTFPHHPTTSPHLLSRSVRVLILLAKDAAPVGILAEVVLLLRRRNATTVGRHIGHYIGGTATATGTDGETEIITCSVDDGIRAVPITITSGNVAVRFVTDTVRSCGDSLML